MRSKPTKLYFAYGSNLNARQMRRRCPYAKPICKLDLPNFKLVFRGVADIVPSLGDHVAGAVYEITPTDELALDRYEGFRKHDPEAGMYRKETFLAKRSGQVVEIMYYAMNSDHESEPSQGYFDCILEGFKDWHLDTTTLFKALKESKKHRADRWRL